MEPWTRLRSYPILNVNYNRIDGTINITQTPFYTNEFEMENKKIWTIPFNFIIESELHSNEIKDTNPFMWLDVKSLMIETNDSLKLKNEKWVLFNKQHTGYYRVNYNEENWNSLIDTLLSDNYDSIPELNRAQLIDDSLSLALEDKLSIDIPLRLMTYLAEKETKFVPWKSAFQAIEKLDSLLFGTEIYHKFQVILFKKKKKK